MDNLQTQGISLPQLGLGTFRMQGDACRAAVETLLEPQELLAACLEIERTMKRVRVERWGPRTIDIDILTFGDRVIDAEHLKVPHPRMTERAFVLIPWLAADGGARLSGEGVAKRVIALDPQERAEIRRLGMMEEL